MLTACSNTPNITIDETIPSSTYTGRGTNAGPMLVGALGATGLAVGLAIDQGIAKEFDQQIQQYKSVYLPKVAEELFKKNVNTTHVSLQSIKFTAVKGNDDLVNVNVIFKLVEHVNVSHVEVYLSKIDFKALKSSAVFWEALLINLTKK